MGQSTPHLLWSAKSRGANDWALPAVHSRAPASFRDLLKRAVFLPIAICLSTLFVLGYEFYDLKSATTHALHKERVFAKIYELRLLLLEVQSGMRGFLLTKDDWFLNPYYLYRPKVQKTLTDLESLINDSNEQLTLLDHARNQIELWLESAHENIEFRKKHPTGLPKSFSTFSGSMTNVRKSILGITAFEEEQFRGVSEKLNISQKSVFIVLTSALVVVSLLVAYLSRYHLTLLARDFTWALRQTQQSEETFRFLAENVQEMVWIAEPDGKLKWLNERWFQYFGFRQTTPLGNLPLRDFVKDSESSLLSDHWNKTVTQKIGFEEQIHLKGSDGVFRLFLLQSKPVLNEKGEVLYLVGTCLDIQNLKDEKTENEFQSKANELLNSALDYQGTLKAISEISVPFLADWATISFFHSDPQSPLRFYHSKHKDPLNEELLFHLRSALIPLGTTAGESLKKEEPVVVESVSESFLLEHVKDPQITDQIMKLGLGSLIIFPIVWGDNLRGVILLAWDRPDRERFLKGLLLGKKLTRLSSQALKNAGLHKEVRTSLRARDEFISVASHQLKTPITSVSLQIQILLRSLERTSKEPEVNTFFNENKTALNLCLSQILRLDNLIDELLDITRIQQGRIELKPAEMDLSILAKDVCNRFSYQAKEQGTSILFQGVSSACGFWDPVRLDQVLSNLLSNALKYGNSKPIICFVEKDSEKGIARLIIEDQGVGISPEMKERIFGRFQRAEATKSIRGLGLGLYISQHIVKAHRGTISVESTLGKGSRFTVTLPLS